MVGPARPLSISAPQEAAHKRLMCRRQACEAQTPESLRRHRSLTAHSLLPLAEKQRRVLRNLRRLEGLGLVSASDSYQGLVDELAKVTAWAWREQKRREEKRRREKREEKREKREDRKSTRLNSSH